MKDNPKMVQAQKEGKVDYSCIPWATIYLLAQAMMEGAEKYGRFNFREDDIRARTYIAAICRHLFGDPATGSIGWVNGEDIDPDSGLPHLYKIMACCLLVEDARLHDKLIDDRLDKEAKVPPAQREVTGTQADLGPPDLFPKDTSLDMDFDEIEMRVASFLATADQDEVTDMVKNTITFGKGAVHMERVPEGDPLFSRLQGDKLLHVTGVDLAEPETDATAWDVVFTERGPDGKITSRKTRGPYTLEHAQSYAQRNPEKLPGEAFITITTKEVRDDHVGN